MAYRGQPRQRKPKNPFLQNTSGQANPASHTQLVHGEQTVQMGHFENRSEVRRGIMEVNLEAIPSEGSQQPKDGTGQEVDPREVKRDGRGAILPEHGSQVLSNGIQVELIGENGSYEPDHRGLT